jgi:hypothetical protein
MTGFLEDEKCGCRLCTQLHFSVGLSCLQVHEYNVYDVDTMLTIPSAIDIL